jgi:hypothetical protein
VRICVSVFDCTMFRKKKKIFIYVDDSAIVICYEDKIKK